MKDLDIADGVSQISCDTLPRFPVQILLLKDQAASPAPSRSSARQAQEKAETMEWHSASLYHDPDVLGPSSLSFHGLRGCRWLRPLKLWHDPSGIPLPPWRPTEPSLSPNHG